MSHRVNYTEAKRYYLDLLGRDPAALGPQLHLDADGTAREWKTATRAYDAAQIELKILTPREVQEHNAATAIRRGRARIVRRAAYA